MKIKRNIYLMCAISLLQGMVFYAPIATLYRQAAGINIFQITIIESISMVLSMVLEVPWGIAADKIGYKKTLLICCGIYVVSKIAFWRADGFGMFLVERILLAVVFAGFSGVDESILYMSSGEKHAQKVFGIYSNLGEAGLLISAGVFSLFLKNNYRLSGLLTVISYGIAFVLAFFLKEVKIPENAQNNNPFKEFFVILKRVFKNKYIFLMLVGIALFSEVHQTVTVFLNQLQYIRSGISNGYMGYIYIGVALAGMLGVFSARITNKLGEKTFAIIIIAIAAISCGVMTFTNLAVISILGIVLLRISYSMFAPLYMKQQNEIVLSSNRATELSVYTVITDSIGVGTNVIFGKIAQMSLSAALGIGAALVVVGGIMYFAWFAHRKTEVC